MGFMSLVIMAEILVAIVLFLIASAISGIICVIGGIYLKKKKRRTEARIVLCAVALHVVIVSFGLYFFLHDDNEPARIETENGEIVMSRKDEDALLDAIREDNKKKLAELLEKEPVYLKYKSNGGLSLLGQSLEDGSYQVTRYLLEQGMDVEDLGDLGDDTINQEENFKDITAIEWYLWNDYDEDKGKHKMVYLLLDYHAAVNRKESSIIQKLLRRLVYDRSLDPEDLELLQRMVEEGADLEQKNKKGENMKEYYQRLLEKKRILERQPELYEKGLEIISGS